MKSGAGADTKDKRTTFKRASEVIFAYSNLIYKLNRLSLIDTAGACSLLSHVAYCLESGVQACSQLWDLLIRDCRKPEDISRVLKKYNYNLVKESSEEAVNRNNVRKNYNSNDYYSKYNYNSKWDQGSKWINNKVDSSKWKDNKHE